VFTLSTPSLSLTATSHHPTDPGLVATEPRLDGWGLVWPRLQIPRLECECEECRQAPVLSRGYLNCHHSELIGSSEETEIRMKNIPYQEFPNDTANKTELFAAVQALNLLPEEYETVKSGP
jgi:hypothetical protein